MRHPTGNVKMAVQSLRASRWRSWLTMLGIIVGVASVVTIVSIGQGIRQQVTGQINHLGKNMLTIRPGTVSTSVSGTLQSFASLTNPSSDATLNSEDLQTVRQTPHVASAVPLSIVPGTVTPMGGQPANNVTVIGTSNDLPSVLSQPVQYGAFFGAEQASSETAVVGSNVATALFGSAAPLGQSFTFRGQQFVIVGVMNPFDTPPLSVDANFNNAIFVPYNIANSLENNHAPLYEILAKTSTYQDTSSVQQAVTRRLQASHSGVKDFTVLTQSQSLAVTDTILNLLTSLISGIAAISLLVGGIGIMNVMLVSVTERTHEIGIRKAIGATNRQIRSQFLTEAVVLSLAGSATGIVISLVINVGLRVITNLQPAISWQIMLLATAVAIVVGIIFGLVPALKAARKDPIAALRNE